MKTDKMADKGCYECLIGIPQACHPERSEGFRVHGVGIFEILSSFGRLNDKK